MQDRENLSIWCLWVGLGLLLLIVLGYSASPVDELSGRPVLLLPDVKAIEDYRQEAYRWARELKTLDGELAQIQADNTGDLLHRSRTAQLSLEEILSLAQDMDQTTAPPALLGLQNDCKYTAQAYSEAAQATLLWISVPDEAHLQEAKTALTAAHSALKQLEKSTWFQPE